MKIVGERLAWCIYIVYLSSVIKTNTMTLTEYAKTAGQRKSKYQVVVTFSNENMYKQVDIFLASSQDEAKEKAVIAYGINGIKSIHAELYRN